MNTQGKKALRAALFGLAATAAWVFGGGRTAVASFQFTPAGGSTSSLNGFVPLSGNALAAGGNMAVADSLLGSGPTTFQLYYQASLSSFLGSNQQAISIPQGQYTVVASITEQVVPGSVSSNGTASFSIAQNQSPNSYVDIYYNPTVVNSPLAGTGFIGSQTVLLGTPTGSLMNGAGGNFTNTSAALGAALQNFDNLPQYAGNPASNPYQYNGSPMQSVQGTGSTTVNFTANYANPAFFPGGVSSVLNLSFNGSTVVPFSGVDPSKQFVTPGGMVVMPVLGAVNGAAYNGTNPDFAFQATGQITQVVPEPSSLCLTALGLCGLLAAARGRLPRNA
jgi:hypothetical protein